MKNKTLLAAAITLSVFCILCIGPNEPTKPTTTLSDMTPTTQPTGTGLSEFQISACNTADEAGTCHTKLPELGVISPEKCCEHLKKCCVEPVLI